MKHASFTKAADILSALQSEFVDAEPNHWHGYDIHTPDGDGFVRIAMDDQQVVVHVMTLNKIVKTTARFDWASPDAIAAFIDCYL